VVLGSVVRALPILIAISALGSADGGIIQSSRYCMVGARYGYLPEIFAYIQKRRLTPLPSIALQVLTFMKLVLQNS
jgi:amino acid transporter